MFGEYEMPTTGGHMGPPLRWGTDVVYERIVRLVEMCTRGLPLWCGGEENGTFRVKVPFFIVNFLASRAGV